ncbi:MAG TPA: tRNA dihydrouridine synthase DusB [Desulfotomaculum sp.]|nr:tRNA dihydrouridine synthase DusB [Desulfotomaculum sp.]
MSATSPFDELLGSGFPVVAAPMAGVSDRIFRSIAREYGARLAWTGMVAAPSLLSGKSFPLDFGGESGVVVQLFGARPEEVAKAAMVAEAAGAAAIDINMGCPVSSVVSGGAGAALMLEPELAGKVVAAVKRRVAVPVTVKMRRGWDEHSPGAVAVAQAVAAAGAAAVIVHGRYRSQFCTGSADRQVIADVKRAVAIPVIGNGDVRSPEEAARMFQETGCDAVMIGRAALGNPWIFAACREYFKTNRIPPRPTPEERIAAAIRHCKMLLSHEGEGALCKMRRQADWYTRGLKGAARLRESIYRTGSFAAIERLLLEFLAACRAGGTLD